MRIWTIVLLLTLGGCEAVIPETMSHYRALDAAKVAATSEQAYKQCLLNLQAAKQAKREPESDCETERKIYEIDRR